jgi:hypothetical protein
VIQLSSPPLCHSQPEGEILGQEATHRYRGRELHNKIFAMRQVEGKQKQQRGAPRSQGEMHSDMNEWSVADWLAFMEGKTELR